MSIIINSIFSPETINIGGEFLIFFIILIIMISQLLARTQFWNKYISNTIDIGVNPLLLIFIVILIFKIKQILLK